MRRLLGLCAVVAGGVVAATAPAGARASLLLNPGTTTCNGHYSGTGQNVVVPTGATCYLVNAHVNRDVKVLPGGALYMSSTTVDHDVTADGAAWVTICHSKIGHDLSVRRTSGPVSIGGALCANTVGHDLLVEANFGSVFVANNAVAHNLSVQNNTPWIVTVSANHTGFDATCANTAQVGIGNTAGRQNSCP